MRDADVPGRVGRAAAPQINVTPLIDILLVLLIIFMVITPLKPTRFKALVPEPLPDRADIHISPRTLTIELRRDARLSLLEGNEVIAEGRLDDASAVATRLAREWSERKARGIWKAGLEARADLAPDERIERTVFVRAPRTAPYGNVARVIDSIKGAGAQPIGLQTDELPN